MRSRLAARSARLVLAAAAVTALAAATAGCDPEGSTDTGSSAAPAASSSRGASETPSSGSTPTSDSTSASGAGTSTGGKGGSSGGSGEKGGSGSSGSASRDKAGYGQSCGTNDLDLTVSWKFDPEIDGYYLITAKAKSGITCYLDVNTPSVSFGSGADGVASPVGQGGEDPIELSGSAVAYAGFDDNTTDGAGTEFTNVIIAVTEGDPNPAELVLPDLAVVDKPIVTNWSTQRGETVPRII
ncbi:hypothetical protein [Streptomyces sp. NPDC086010]|uniref:hypothetical protein n=1 Tax=Streptomyces sp. NPDC086010 TaxID=3365745 RepID=UPI0037D4DF2C